MDGQSARKNSEKSGGSILTDQEIWKFGWLLIGTFLSELQGVYVSFVHLAFTYYVTSCVVSYDTCRLKLDPH